MKEIKSKLANLFILACALASVTLITILIWPKSKGIEVYSADQTHTDEAADVGQAISSLVTKDAPMRSSGKLGQSPNVSIDAAASKRIDESINKFLTADLCDDPRLNKEVTTRDLISYKKSKGRDDDRVIATSELQLRTLCDSTSRNSTDVLDVSADLSTYVQKNSPLLQEVDAFIDIINEDAAKGRGIANTDQAHDFVRSKIRQSTGLHEFMEIVTALNDANVLAPALRDLGYPVGIQRDDAAAAGIVAACRIFGGCEASSVFSISLCFLVCDHPMGAVEYALSSVPALRVGTVERASLAMIAARSGK